VRIITWNINKRRDFERQAQALLEMDPDIVVLQEVVARAWTGLRQQLLAGGLVHSQSGWDLATASDASRRLVSFVAVASRWPLLPARGARVPAQEAVACVAVEAPAGLLDVIGVTFRPPRGPM
jgi:exonuclease III